MPNTTALQSTTEEVCESNTVENRQKKASVPSDTGNTDSNITKHKRQNSSRTEIPARASSLKANSTVVDIVNNNRPKNRNPKQDQHRRLVQSKKLVLQTPRQDQISTLSVTAIPDPSTGISPSDSLPPPSSLTASSLKNSALSTPVGPTEDKENNIVENSINNLENLTGNSGNPSSPSQYHSSGDKAVNTLNTSLESSSSAAATEHQKQEGHRPKPVSSYYSTVALREIQNLSNVQTAVARSPVSTVPLTNLENTNNSKSQIANNGSSIHRHSPNRASISFPAANHLFSRSKTVAGGSSKDLDIPVTTTIDGDQNKANLNSSNSRKTLTRRKTLSSRRAPPTDLYQTPSLDISRAAPQSNTDRLVEQTARPSISARQPIPAAAGQPRENLATSASQKPQPEMHQSSSRLLRMTQDDRPFTKDFKDLFATLMVSLPLTPHRLRFKTYYFTFTSDEAVNNLGSLKFSQSNRMPDPKDPSRIVTTTTTTTFSMAKEMARTVCQKFVLARFMEAVAEKPTTPFTSKNILWQLTPKGIHVLEGFCQRNGINSPHVISLLASPHNTMRLVVLERDAITDKISQDRPSLEIIFRRFAGPVPNIKQHTTASDSDSISEYTDGNTGIRIAESRKVFDKIIKYSFTGKAAVDWLLDCCTTIEPTETHEIAGLFIRYGLIQSVVEDKIYIQQVPKAKDFQPTKTSIYIITERGKRVAGWISQERDSIENGKMNGQNGYQTSTTLASQGSRPGRGGRGKDDRENRETNTTRLSCILADPALRLLFREFLRETLCEENLSFWLDVQDFQLQFKALNEKTLENIRETLAAAYGIYNAFLAPGSPCELNIDHTLRQDLAARMTRAVAKDEQSMYTSLKEVAGLFERAQEQVFKLMAGDSVPKFAKTARYIEISGDNISDEGSPHGTPPPPERSNPRKMQPK